MLLGSVFATVDAQLSRSLDNLRAAKRLPSLSPSPTLLRGILSRIPPDSKITPEFHPVQRARVLLFLGV